MLKRASRLFVKVIFLILFLTFCFERTGHAKTASVQRENVRVIDIKVTLAGYEPDKIIVREGEKVKLRVTRVSDDTCATEILIPKLNLKKSLPLNKTVELNLGRVSKGDLPFGCGMSLMVNGLIQVK